MSRLRCRTILFILASLIAAVSAFAQNVDHEARAKEWQSYKLPTGDFARYVDNEKAILIRVPASWQQAGHLQFNGPHGAELRVIVDKIPDGLPLKSYTNAVLQNLRNLPGGADALTVRQAEVAGLEAREFLFTLPDARGQESRRLIWLTVSGPHAFSFLLIVPEAKAGEVEPYFKAAIETAVIFESEAHYDNFERIRGAAIKTNSPVRVDEVQSLVNVINGYDAVARTKAVEALTAIFDSTPDAAVDLLVDRRPLVRAAAVAALGRSSNRGLDGFLLQALADRDSVVAARAAAALAKREDALRLLKEDSADWKGLQIERVMRAIPWLAEPVRLQIATELLKRERAMRVPGPALPVGRVTSSWKPERALPPPPPAKTESPGNESAQSKAAPPTSGTDADRNPPPPPPPAKAGGVPGGIPVPPPPPAKNAGGAVGIPAPPPPPPRLAAPKGATLISFMDLPGFNDDLIVLGLLPDLDVLKDVLPASRLLGSPNHAATKFALMLALNSRTKLPVDQLMELISGSDDDLARLAASNLAVSATAADLARIEALVGTPPVNAPPGGEAAEGKARLRQELRTAAKRIRWRERLASAAGAPAREEIIKGAFADDDLAAWAWPYIRDHIEGARPAHRQRGSNQRQPTTSDAQNPSLSISSLGENLLPENVTLYTAIPDAQALIDKLGSSLSSIKLDSARTQANLLLMLKGMEGQLGRLFGAPAGAGVLESSGIRPHSPIVLARWTAPSAPRGLATAHRRAVVVRVNDRDRFEHFVATYQRQLGRFEMTPDYVALGARFLSVLPSFLPLAASALIEGGGPSTPARFTPKYNLIGSDYCLGYPVTVIERREVDAETALKRDTVYLTYIGDAAVLAPDWFSLRDCLTRLGVREGTLESNIRFKQAVAAGGDVIYLSDPLAVIGMTSKKEGRQPLAERGALRITTGSWESSFDISFNKQAWQGLLPFQASQLKAPSVLLPRSTVAYFFVSLDVAASWRNFVRDVLGAETTKQFESIWTLDFEREVLPELGTECGAALLALPSIKSASFNAPWAVFVQTKSDKLSRAFAEGKLVKGVSADAKAGRVKIGSADYWIAARNGFLVIAGSDAAIAKLESSERLSAARDFARAATNAPRDVVAFGGTNMEAATAGLAGDLSDPVIAQVVGALASLARAFHSQNLLAAISEDGLKARMSVSLDREGRFSASDLASPSATFDVAAADVEARGVPIVGQERLESLTLKISCKAPDAIDRIKADLSSAAQVVEKRSESELLVTIRPRRAAPANKIELPVTGAEFAPFLKPSILIRSENQSVVAKAREIAGDDRDAWSVARKLADWTYKNLKWKRVDSADAATTLATREADCLEFSELFVAMARALGLPARIVMGLAHSGGSFGGHAWIEVWAGEWVEMDPTWGTNFVDATHLRMAGFELAGYAMLNLVGMEVIEARRAVAEYQKTPESLAEAFGKALDAEESTETLSVAIDPEIIVDAQMGDGAWSKMSTAERDRVYSFHRRLVADLHSEFGNDLGVGSGIHVLSVKQDEDRARALLLRSDWSGALLVDVRLVRKGGVWFVAELTNRDLAFDLIGEALRPTLLVIKAKRDGAQPPGLLASVEARILATLGADRQQALEIAREALKQNPGSQTLRHLLALCLQQSAKEDSPEMTEAIKLWTELSGEQPAFPPAIRQLGEHYALADANPAEVETNRDKAISLLGRYATLVPEDPRPHDDLARVYEGRKQADRAEAEYRAVVALDPLDAGNYAELARFLVAQGRYQDALAVVDQSRGQGASKDDLFAGLFLASEGESGAARAEALAATAPERLATNFEANINLATVRINDDRAREALPLLKTATRLEPERPEPHVSMAEAYRSLRNWNAALKAADEAIRLGDEEGDAHFHKACALAQLRRPAEAIAALRKAIELDEFLVFTDDLESEPDLKPLATQPQFKKLMEEIKRSDETPADGAKKKEDK